jgi:hypothetical protein
MKLTIPGRPEIEASRDFRGGPHHHLDHPREPVSNLPRHRSGNAYGGADHSGVVPDRGRHTAKPLHDLLVVDRVTPLADQLQLFF